MFAKAEHTRYHTNNSNEKLFDSSVAITVKYPEVTIVNTGSHPFKNGETFFYYSPDGDHKEFRYGLQLKISFIDDLIPITEEMVTGNKIQVVTYMAHGMDAGEYPAENFKGFWAGKWTVSLMYSYNDATYTFDYVIKNI